MKIITHFTPDADHRQLAISNYAISPSVIRFIVMVGCITIQNDEREGKVVPARREGTW